MIKKIITLVVASSVLSAGLLYLGFAVMGKYTPAHASSLNALVARSTGQNTQNILLVEKRIPVTGDLRGGAEKSDVTLPSVVPDIPVSSGQPLPVSVNPVSSVPSVAASADSTSQTLAAADKSNPALTSVAGVTIAQLLNSPDQYLHQVISIIGIATSLNSDKFLFNDGTGQIVVEVEDDLIGLKIIDGMSITVMGMLDDSSSQSGIALDAYTITDQNGTIITDDCPDDDGLLDDDCIDDIDDDCPDDNDDLNDDDCSNDDCSDDDSSSDDSSDDDSSSDDSSDDDSSDDDSSDDDSSSDDSSDDGEDD